MKRILCVLLILLLLCGCDVSGGAGQTAPAKGAAHIVVTLPTIDGSDMTGLPEVQAAVNAITVPEIGVEVEFMTIPALTTAAEYPSMITAGKQIDLMVLNNENIENYVNQHMLLPLDSLLAACGQQILKIDSEYSLSEGSTFGGTVYGLSNPSITIGQCAGLWISRDLLEEVSFHYEPEKIYSFDELDVLFSRLKKAYPDAYPLGQITNNYGFSTSSFFLGLAFDSLFSADPAVLSVDDGGTELIDLYESRQFRTWLEYMRKWYLDGYIYPDSAITTATSLGLLQAGIVLSVPQSGTPYMLEAEDIGYEIVPMRLSPVRRGIRSNMGIFWTIPVTSREPEAAMRFLNMMFSDKRIVNLLAWGIHGRDYTLDAPGGFAELESRCYVNPLGMFGDQRLRYEVDGETRRAVRDTFSKKAVCINEQYMGFSFNSSGLTQELLEIEKVKGQYLKLLEAGCVDLDTVYPEFIQKLYDAGLQRVIDEKQRQFDAWLAENQEN